MGSCQNYGPFSGTLNNRCRIFLRTPKETIILIATHMHAAAFNNDARIYVAEWLFAIIGLFNAERIRGHAKLYRRVEMLPAIAWLWL